jgi:NAD(P)-dependent dehydrogenase (short-subunit alcohol dehydrogenase family)
MPRVFVTGSADGLGRLAAQTLLAHGHDVVLHVAAKRRGTRRYAHPVVGEITLEWDSLTSDAEPDQQLIVYTAEPGSRSEQALRDLAAWAEEHISTPR